MRRTAVVVGVAMAVAIALGGGPVGALPAPPSSSPPGQGRPEDPPEVQQAARDGLIVAAEMAAVIDQLGGFAEPVPEDLAAVVDAVEWPAQDDVELIDELVVLEADGEDVLAELVGAVEPLDPSVTLVLGGPDDATWAALEDGAVGAVDAAPYLVAVDALATRSGRPGLDPRTPPPDGDRLAALLDGAYAAADDPPAPSTTTADQPAGGASSGGSSLPWLAAAVAVALVAIGAVVLLARRRSPSDQPERFGDLLEVSRRLAAAGDAAQVERIAAVEAARLVEGSAGAVVHRDGAALRVGYETEPGLLVGDQLEGGLLARAVETGQPVVAVVRDEPAVRSLPVALTAAPVISDGRVQALVVVVRPAERPFVAAEVDALRSLGPVLAAALDSARRVAAVATASLTDPLTGVGNRRRLEEELPPLLGSGQATAVVMVDLDHFKAVNDRWGHPAGDAVLRQTAEVLVAAVRPDDRVYRYGGEEFALVLPGTDEAEAAAAAERVRRAVEAATLDLGDGTTHRITTSLGVAASDGDAPEGALALVARADRALYRAKEGGRNRVVAASSTAT